MPNIATAYVQIVPTAQGIGNKRAKARAHLPVLASLKGSGQL